jgi:riboflavin biosynthesis pyrimidine reductase
VCGKGLKRLRDAGIEVVEGVRREACETMVRAFATHVTKGRPHVVLKVASTLDGKLATASGDSKWITSEASRALVHRWRDEFDAILVGAGTVIADDPQLTTRLEAPVVEGRPPRNPLRIVLSGRLRVPLSAKVFDASVAPTIVYTAYPKGVSALALQARGVEVAGGRKVIRTSRREDLLANTRRDVVVSVGDDTDHDFVGSGGGELGVQNHAQHCALLVRAAGAAPRKSPRTAGCGDLAGGPPRHLHPR